MKLIAIIDKSNKNDKSYYMAINNIKSLKFKSDVEFIIIDKSDLNFISINQTYNIIKFPTFLHLDDSSTEVARVEELGKGLLPTLLKPLLAE